MRNHVAYSISVFCYMGFKAEAQGAYPNQLDYYGKFVGPKSGTIIIGAQYQKPRNESNLQVAILLQSSHTTLIRSKGVMGVVWKLRTSRVLISDIGLQQLHLGFMA